MDEQEKVAAFIDRHDLKTGPTYRTLDLVSEVGEVAKEVAESTGYGAAPEDADVSADELGDVLFALLGLADELGIDATAALDLALEKYERRLEHKKTPSSGE